MTKGCTLWKEEAEEEVLVVGDVQASRPKLALWRSARERGIWMQDMASAQASTSAAEVAYLAALLSDK